MTKLPYKITKVGGAHAQQEAERKEDLPKAPFKQYGFGDIIYLDPKEVTAGKWDHLLPSPVVKGMPKSTNKPVTVEPEEPDEEEPEPEVTGDDILTPEALEALITAVDDSTGKDEFNTARQSVIDADVFEEGTVPTSKSKLIQALSNLRAE